MQSRRLRRFQLILGPRRVGKTTTLYQTVRRLLSAGVSADRLHWLRIDHPLLMQRELGDLVRGLIEQSGADDDKPIYVFLDEVVYARDWDLWLKTMYDEQWPLCIAASASSTAVLRDRLQESGVGRWSEQYLPPYLLTEYLELVGAGPDFTAAPTLAESLRSTRIAAPELGAVEPMRRRFLISGGFPELLLAAGAGEADEETRILESQRMLRGDAIERAIYKDIPQAYGVDNPMTLEKLLYILAEQASGVLSPTSICQSVERITPPTFEKYLTYLERSFLVFTLQNYSGSERSRQTRGRKLYFVDGAVRNAALQRGLAPLSDPEEMGLLLENAVAGHLHALARQTQTRLHYWRDRNTEVDFIFDQPGAPVAIEVARSARHHRRGLAALIDRYPAFHGSAWLAAPDAIFTPPDRSDSGVGAIPLDQLLLITGRLAERGLEERLAVS